jgi:hypothetical protein
MPSTWTTSRSQRSPSQWSSLTTPRSSLPTSLTYAYPASRRQHDGCTYAETRTYPWPYSPSARNHKTGLYMVNPPSDPTGSTLVANMVIKSQTQADQVRFGVATMGSPPTATLLKASTKPFLTGVPGTTPSLLLRKHPPDRIAAANGHLRLDMTLRSRDPIACAGKPDRTLNGTAWWTLAVSFSNPPGRSHQDAKPSTTNPTPN